MPYDPTYPADGILIRAVEMRNQLNALNDRITALETALAGTALNPNLSQLSIALSEPPARAEVQQIVDLLNTLLNQITRV